MHAFDWKPIFWSTFTSLVRSVSYTHLRAHETDSYLVCRLLLENVWDYHFDPQTNVIDVQISRLRSKIDKDFEQPLLHTVRGAGYKLVEG